jgi:hypothetical protein
MAEKNMDKMKDFIAHKKDGQKNQSKFIPDKKIGAGQGGKNSMKSTGANNKV